MKYPVTVSKNDKVNRPLSILMSGLVTLAVGLTMSIVTEAVIEDIVGPIA